MFLELSNSELYELNGGGVSARDVVGAIGGGCGAIGGAIGGATLGIGFGGLVSFSPVVALVCGGIGFVGGGYAGYHMGKAAAYEAYDTVASWFN